jgi:hypothetical protein
LNLAVEDSALREAFLMAPRDFLAPLLVRIEIGLELQAP